MYSVRIISLWISLVCGGIFFYDLISSNVGFLSMGMLLFFVIASIVSVLIPSTTRIRYVHKYLSSLVIWACMSSLMIIVYSYNKFRNWSTVIYSVEYYWEEGVYLDFRENGTFRAKNTDIVSSSLSYGEYEKIDSFIILLDKVEFGMSKMSDTLIVRDEGIYFTLESPWREISEATLFYSRK